MRPQKAQKSTEVEVINARDEFVSREGENIELGGRLCVEEHEAGAED